MSIPTRYITPITSTSTTPLTLTAETIVDYPFFNWTGGVGTLTLPDISTVINGWTITFTNSGTNTLAVTPDGTDKIAGVNAAVNLTTANRHMILVANKATSDWISVKGPSP